MRHAQFTIFDPLLKSQDLPVPHGHLMCVPHTLPARLDQWPVCICHQHQCVSKSEFAGPDWTKSNEWQALAWHVGGEEATWLCRWADLQQNPKRWLDAMLVIADMHWNARLERVPERHTREVIFVAIGDP